MALIILSISFFSSSLCFAENFYAITEHQLTDGQGNIYNDNEGNKFSMQTTTKTFNENICNDVAKTKGTTKGMWLSTGTLCVKGTDMINGVSKTWDDAGEWMFENQPSQVRGIYLSFTDNSGYQTRIQFHVLAGPNYPIPGYPGEIKTEQILPIAQAFIKALELEGIKDAKIIYPEKT